MWGAILTVLAQLGIWILGKLNASKEKQENFLKFIKWAANDTKSTKLMKIWRKQQDWFDTHPWPETNVKK